MGNLKDVQRSLIRGLPRIALLVALGVANLLIAHAPELAGLQGGPMPILAPLCMGAGLVFLGLAGGDFALRILQPKIDAQGAASDAIENKNTAAGLVYLGRSILAAVIVLLVATAPRAASAAEPPAAALPYLPILAAEQRAHWPDMPLPSALGAQVEMESRWNPRAQLKTSREQGIGFAQLTRTWHADGRPRFDALAEIRAAFPRELAGLSWDNPYDPALQLRALVLKDRQEWQRTRNTATPADRLAMSFAAYNGGAGGLASDRRACAATQGCDPGQWFGHVERTSLKAKTAVAGYGRSFFEINRHYVREIMQTRRVRYAVLDKAAT